MPKTPSRNLVDVSASPASSSAARRGHALARPGYTMIELLTVLAIIGIVSGIIVIGLRAVGGSSKRDQTISTLDRMNNAMTELTSTTAGAQKLYTIQLPNIYFPEPQANNFPNSGFKTWIGVPVGALESQARTARVLNEIVSANPSAKAFLEELPPEQRGKYTTTIGAATITNNVPVPLDGWGNPILFVFDGLQIATGTNVGRPFTVDLGAGPEVEVGGATMMYSDTEKTYYEPAQALTPVPTYSGTTGSTNMPQPPKAYVRPTGYTPRVGPTGQPEYRLRSPDNRPFWMSAGPDGKYETHDDNVYSFRN